MNHLLNGFLITAGLIMAIGAQNAFVLKQGLLRQHVGLVVLLCWLCDVILISTGVFGVSALLANAPYFSAALSLAGGIFLLVYGCSSAKRAYIGGNYLSVDTQTQAPTSAWKTALTTLALTLLNPHVYIDAVVLIGGSASHLDTEGKLQFLGGSLSASAIWFCGIGFGSYILQPLFRREVVWQILDGVIALVMFYLAFGLLQQAFAVFF